MIGSDLKRLQELINSLEEMKVKEQEENLSTDKNTNEVEENNVVEDTLTEDIFARENE